MTLNITKIPLKDIPQLSKRDLAYISEAEDLRPFYKYPVQLEQFEQVMMDKGKDNTNRNLLVKVLEQQYLFLSKNQKVLDNIQLLKEDNSFTVTTAHQPVLFTGPLYYIYKILSTITLSEVLKAQYPSSNFVPVFVSGAEDHDFEEINHATIFGKKLLWENEEKGPVGKMDTKSLASAIEQLSGILGTSENANQIIQTIKQAYQNNSTYGMATIQLVHELFKRYGLVILDMSHSDLKRAAIPLFKEELLHSRSADFVKSTIDDLHKKGYKAQASPRDINLFYLGNQLRERIVKENNTFKVLNSPIQFTENELLEELEKYPERFSPNVIMRPLFQELILPNLAYIGGGGEIAYWLERKTQFEHFGINFPMLIRRCSGLIITASEQKKRSKLALTIPDLFRDESQLVKEFLHKNADTSLDLAEERKTLAGLFKNVLAKAEAIDPTLSGTVKAEENKQLKSMAQMEAKIVKAEKRKKEQQIKQITQLLDRLFPGQSLQERKVNFLSFYLEYGDTFFDLLKEALNPLEKQFVVFHTS